MNPTAEAWDEGMAAGWADAGRWADGTPYTGDTPNPYREGSKTPNHADKL